MLLCGYGARLVMMTSSNRSIFRVTGHLCGEFNGPRWIPRTIESHAELWYFFDLCLNKRLSKHSWGCWFEALARPLWCHCNVLLSMTKFGRIRYGCIQLTLCVLINRHNVNVWCWTDTTFIITVATRFPQYRCPYSSLQLHVACGNHSTAPSALSASK